MNPAEISLVKVRRNDEHAAVLYELLQRRVHPISHRSLPTWREHRDFVLKHPYRAWYLIKADEAYVGNIYVLRNNCIGVSAIGDAARYVPPAITAIMKKHRPLPAIRSVRAGKFDVNLAPGNEELGAILQGMGAKLTQVTYTLDPD